MPLPVAKRPHQIEAGYLPYETITGPDMRDLTDSPVWSEVYRWQLRAAVLAAACTVLVLTNVATLYRLIYR